MITLSELKKYLGITDTDKDAVLQGFINSAVSQLDTECNRTFLAADHTEYINCCYGVKNLYLGNYPINSVTTLEYHNGDAYTALIDGTGHTIDNSVNIINGYLTLNNNYNFSGRQLKIVYNAGYKFRVGTGKLKILKATPTLVEGLFSSLFTTEIAVGDWLYFEGVRRQVATIVDAAHLTLTEAVLISIDNETAYISVPYIITNVPKDLQQGCLELAAMKYYESGIGKELLIKSSEGTNSAASSSVNYKKPDQSSLYNFYRVWNI